MLVLFILNATDSKQLSKKKSRLIKKKTCRTDAYHICTYMPYKDANLLQKILFVFVCILDALQLHFKWELATLLRFM